MERGGPEVTEGLSPRIRSYSRMSTWPKVMPPRVVLRGRPAVLRWRDSWRVREVMMDRMGWDSMDGAQMEIVGAEWLRRVEEEERLSELLLNVWRLPAFS